MNRRARFAVALYVFGGTVAGIAAFFATRPAAVELAEPATERGDSRDRDAPPLAVLEGRARVLPAAVREAEPAGGREGATGGGAASRISGQVLDPEGKPLRGAQVRAVGASGAAVVTAADEDGRFALDPPPGGAVALEVSATGYAETSVPPSAFMPGMKVPLPKGWEISGTVRDAATDAPIVAISLTARPATSPEGSHPSVGTWREDGSFVVTVPEAGAYVLDVGNRYRDGAPEPGDDWIATRVDGVEAGTRGLRVALTRGLSIEGRIVDEAGDPVARAVSIDAVGRTASGDADYTARKFVHVWGGDLRVSGLKPGRYDLWVWPILVPEDAGESPFSATVVRDVEAGTRSLTVRLSRGVVLTGRLEDGAGEAVLGKGWVYAYRTGEMGRSHPAVGDVPGDGTFRVGPVDRSYRYDLLATGFEGRRQGTVTGVLPGDAGVVVVLAKAGRISGRIETADGKPVPAGVPVGVMGEGADARAAGFRVFGYSTAQGTFAVDGLADFTFSVEAGGGRSGFLGVLVAGVKPGTTDLVLKVSVGVDLSGVLLDDKGDPVATTSLQADDGARMAAMRPYAQVGSDGAFVLRGLRAGRVRLSLRRGGSYVAAGEVDAPATGIKVVVPAR